MSSAPSKVSATSPPAIGELLLHPVALVAIALTFVNDHVLKVAYPSWTTGKLSDIAGLTYFPLLLCSCSQLLRWSHWRFRRRPGSPRVLPWELALAVSVTLVVFCSINLSETASAACETALSALFNVRRIFIAGAPYWQVHNTVDPSDLLAVPALALSIGVYRSTYRVGGAP